VRGCPSLSLGLCEKYGSMGGGDTDSGIQATSNNGGDSDK
jgi:hypothetical protein